MAWDEAESDSPALQQVIRFHYCFFVCLLGKVNLDSSHHFGVSFNVPFLYFISITKICLVKHFEKFVCEKHYMSLVPEYVA